MVLGNSNKAHFVVYVSSSGNLRPNVSIFALLFLHALLLLSTKSNDKAMRSQYYLLGFKSSAPTSSLAPTTA